MNFSREQIVTAMERAGLGANQRSRFMAVAHMLMRAGAEIKLEEAAKAADKVRYGAQLMLSAGVSPREEIAFTVQETVAAGIAGGLRELAK